VEEEEEEEKEVEEEDGEYEDEEDGEEEEEDACFSSYRLSDIITTTSLVVHLRSTAKGSPARSKSFPPSASIDITPTPPFPPASPPLPPLPPLSPLPPLLSLPLPRTLPPSCCTAVFPMGTHTEITVGTDGAIGIIISSSSSSHRHRSSESEEEESEEEEELLLSCRPHWTATICSLKKRRLSKEGKGGQSQPVGVVTAPSESKYCRRFVIGVWTSHSHAKPLWNHTESPASMVMVPEPSEGVSVAVPETMRVRSVA
jgi:hypothetical protein